MSELSGQEEGEETPDIEVRELGAGDFTAVARIARATGQPETGAGPDSSYLAHITGRGRMLVAVEDGGEVVAFGGVVLVGVVLQLTDLFVSPERQGCGIGRRLLQALVGAPKLWMTFASSHPRAVRLYASAGLAPRWPLYYLRGPNPARLIARFAAPVTAEKVDPLRAASAERVLTRVDRSADYRYWTRDGGSAGVVLHADGRLVAAAAVSGDEVAHLCCPDALYAGAAVRAAAAQLRARQVRFCIPGPHPALPSLLEDGYAIEDCDTHMSSRPGLVSETALLSPALI